MSNPANPPEMAQKSEMPTKVRLRELAKKTTDNFAKGRLGVPAYETALKGLAFEAAREPRK